MRTILTTLVLLLSLSAGSAWAVTLNTLCDSEDVTRSVIRYSKRLKFPADAQRLKPSNAYFLAESGPLSCTYSLTAGNAYDFGEYKATFVSPSYGRLKVISLTPIE